MTEVSRRVVSRHTTIRQHPNPDLLDSAIREAGKLPGC
jgi:hypothetical protein